MPKFSEMIESKYLKKEDVGGESGILVTIANCFQVNVALPGVEPEMKWALTFEELDKPLVLNVINTQLLAKITAVTHTDDCIGKKIVLYEEPNVTMGGKLVGGVRIRAARIQTGPKVPERKQEQP